MRNRLTLYLLIILALGWASSDLAYGQQAIVFGPETFTRSTGEPETFIRNFSLNLPLQEFTISVQNGEGRHGRISSAVVELNGQQVLGPNDFNQQVDLITKPVVLQAQNTVSVELRSSPGRAIVVTIHGQFPSATETIPSDGGTVNLNGLASVIFPNGSFSSAQPVTVTVTNSADVHEDFSARAEGPRIPYEIRVKVGNVPPATSVDVILNVPESFVASLPQNHQFEMFAQPIEFSETETLGHFKGYASTFDSATNTLRATLPPAVFNDDASDEIFEAIFIIGAIPQYQRRTVDTQSSSSGNSRKSARTDTVTVASLSLTGLLAAAAPICEGSPLGNPLERTPVLGSPFNPSRDHWGADYPGTSGENIHPVADGIVTQIGFDSRPLPRPNPRSGLMVRGWGRYVVITHEDGSQTLYAHLVPESTNHLTQGQAVSTSTVIGQVGSSGGSTSPHLHIEYSPEGRIRAHDTLVDPHPCIEAGQEPPGPLVLSPQNPTLTCPGGSVTFTATGGRPPYTWSKTAGVLTVTGVNSQNAQLKPPENTGSGVAGDAYRFYRITHADVCAPSNCPTPQTRRQCSASKFYDRFSCADVLLGIVGSCGQGGSSACGSPCGTGLTDSFCTDQVIQTATTCTLGGFSGIGIFDVRTQQMIDAGCKPCAVEMKDGATVTVRDAAGDEIGTNVTVP